VEKILDESIDDNTKQHFYQVKWEGYKEPTWEPKANLRGCRESIREFERERDAKAIVHDKAPRVRGGGRGRGRGLRGRGRGYRGRGGKATA
jgi:hypothetical protein